MAEELENLDSLPEEEREEIPSLNMDWLKTNPLNYYHYNTDGLILRFTRHVNNRADLQAALSGYNYIVEGDIVMSKRQSSPKVPIMGRPGSDGFLEISLHKWIRKMGRMYAKGGFLLHFREEEAIVHSLKHIRRARVIGPKILSAEVFRAEDDSPEPINPEQFLGACRHMCPRAYLCFGWTANISDMIARGVGYSERCLSRLVAFLKYYAVDNHVLFSVHFMLLLISIPQVQQLLNRVPNSTLYVWSDDRIRDITDFNMIRSCFDCRRVYYNLPDLDWG